MWSSDRMAFVKICTVMVGCKRYFVFVTVFDLDLPVPRMGVSRQDYACLASAVETLDHSGKWVGVLDGESVQLSVVDSEL